LSSRELGRLGIAQARAERNNTELIFVLAAIRLLIITGCRRNKILELQWKDIIFKRAMLLLPETKTGARPVYLSAPVLSALARLRDVRVHDLRHSFASIGVNGGASLPIIGKLRGYAKGSTTEKYSPLAANPVRAVNDAMGSQTAAMLNGHKGNGVEFNKKFLLGQER
jgi:integrase